MQWTSKAMNSCCSLNQCCQLWPKIPLNDSIFEITMTNFEKIDIPSFPERLFQSKIRQSWQHWSKLQGQSSWVKVLMQSNLLLGLVLVNNYWKINYGQGSWHQRKRSIFQLLKMNSLKIETIKAAAASERR